MVYLVGRKEYFRLRMSIAYVILRTSFMCKGYLVKWLKYALTQMFFMNPEENALLRGLYWERALVNATSAEDR